MEFIIKIYYAIEFFAMFLVFPFVICFYFPIEIGKKYPKYESILYLGIILYAPLRYPMSHLFALLLRG